MALRLGPAFLRSQGLPNPLSPFVSPIDQQRGVQTFATEKRTDAAADGGRRLRFAQDAHFVFRGVVTPPGSSHDFGVRMRGGRLGFGWDWGGARAARALAPPRLLLLQPPPPT